MSNAVAVDQNPRSNPHLLRRFGIAVVVCLGLAVAVGSLIAFARGLRYINEPFQMALFMIDGQTYVQFARPDDEMVSPRFPVNLRVDEKRQYVLDSADVAIPGCTIESYDITIFPGRYTMRIGETRIDMMQSRINVDGADYGWTRGRLTSNGLEDGTPK